MTAPSTVEAVPSTAVVDVLDVTTGRRRLLRSALRRPLGLAGFVLLLLLVLVAVLAPLLAPHEPDEMLDAPNLAPPAAEHPLGTDNLGRDNLSRILHGSRVSLTVGLVSVGVAVLVGGLLGMLCGYFLGLLDLGVQRLMDALMAVPTLILAVVIGISLGPSVTTLLISIAVAFVPQVQRVVRSAVIAVRGQPFVEAATAGGSRPLRVLFLHVAPQIVAPTLVIATALMGQAIIIESAISFVGAGPPPPTATWGGMLNAGMNYHPSRAPWLVLFPGMAIFLSVFAFNLVGDALRDLLDPRLDKA